MSKPLLVLLAAVWLTGCVIVIADDGNYSRADFEHEPRTLTLSAAELDSLVATTGGGSFELIGEAGREDIEVKADIYYSNPDNIQLQLERSGGRARLQAHMRNDSARSNWGYIDLVVRVPARFALDLEDGSGEIKVRGLQGAVKIRDGSGALALNGGASADIKDGSGSLLVENITGDVSIEDGSGALEVRQVGSTVTIRDGSGAITVRDVGGLNIIEAGSGGLSVRDVRGAVSL